MGFAMRHLKPPSSTGCISPSQCCVSEREEDKKNWYSQHMPRSDSLSQVASYYNTHPLSQDFELETIKVSQLGSSSLPGDSPCPGSLLPLGVDVCLFISLPNLLLSSRMGNLKFKVRQPQLIKAQCLTCHS